MNNPVNLVDPSGQNPLVIAAALGGLIGAIGGAIFHALANPCESIGDMLTSGDFWRDVGVGALSGALAGLVGAFMPQLLVAAGLNIQAGILAAVLGGALTGAVVSGTAQVVTNLLTGQDWKAGLGSAVLTGAVIGGIAGGVGFWLRNWRATPQKTTAVSGQNPTGSPLTTAEKNTLRNQSRRVFLNANPRFQKFAGTFKMEIHHRIPLQWSHLVPSANPNRLSNLFALSRSFHRSVVTPAWNAFAGRNSSASASDVLRFAKDMDKVIGWLINRIP